MLSVIPVGASVRLFFPLVVAQLFVVLPRSRIIASAACRIRPEVNLAFLDHSPYNLFLSIRLMRSSFAGVSAIFSWNPAAASASSACKVLFTGAPAQPASTINNPGANIARIGMRLSHAICYLPISSTLLHCRSKILYYNSGVL